MAGKTYEVMVDTYGWGDPFQFVRGDVIEAADAKGADLEWAEKMGSIRVMNPFEVRALEAREDDNGYNPHRNPVTNLLSTVRMFEEEAAARDASGVDVDEFQDDQPKSIPTGGGTGVDQVKLENEQAGLTGDKAKESTSSGASSTPKKDDDKR
jgi:hypothetical protein